MNNFNTVNVKNRSDFSNFIELLLKDYLTNPEKWENKTLPDFFEALARYVQDIQGYYDNTKQTLMQMNLHGAHLQICF